MYASHYLHESLLAAEYTPHSMIESDTLSGYLSFTQVNLFLLPLRTKERQALGFCTSTEIRMEAKGLFSLAWSKSGGCEERKRLNIDIYVAPRFSLQQECLLARHHVQ